MKTWQLLKQQPRLFQRYFVKEYLIKGIRSFFEKRKYHELESPILTDALPQERYLDVLETEISLKDAPSKKKILAYLIPSTETFNKKILAAGLGAHFVISKVFRGLEAIGPNHSHEFTMCEWYHPQANYFDLMADCENLILELKRFLDLKFRKKRSNEITFQQQIIDLTPPWPRIKVADALKQFAGLNLKGIEKLSVLQKVARFRGYKIDDKDDWQGIFELIFLNEVEPFLPANKPYFLYDYPKIMCPLAKTNSKNPLVSEKVELFIVGKEIANGYTEQLDAQKQLEVFLKEQAARKKLGKKAIKIDKDLIAALKSGLSNVAGIGMGIDRLAMIFADAKNISEVNYFPANEMFQ